MNPFIYILSVWIIACNIYSGTVGLIYKGECDHFPIWNLVISNYVIFCNVILIKLHVLKYNILYCFITLYTLAFILSCFGIYIMYKDTCNNDYVYSGTLLQVANICSFLPAGVFYGLYKCVNK
jgi:hypothetical protein